MIEVKALSVRFNFYRLIIFTMKTALYKKKFKKTLNQRKLVRLKNTIAQSLFFYTVDHKVH